MFETLHVPLPVHQQSPICSDLRSATVPLVTATIEPDKQLAYGETFKMTLNPTITLDYLVLVLNSFYVPLHWTSHVLLLHQLQLLADGPSYTPISTIIAERTN